MTQQSSFIQEIEFSFYHEGLYVSVDITAEVEKARTFGELTARISELKKEYNDIPNFLGETPWTAKITDDFSSIYFNFLLVIRFPMDEFFKIQEETDGFFQNPEFSGYKLVPKRSSDSDDISYSSVLNANGAYLNEFTGATQPWGVSHHKDMLEYCSGVMKKVKEIKDEIDND